MLKTFLLCSFFCLVLNQAHAELHDDNNVDVFHPSDIIGFANTDQSKPPSDGKEVTCKQNINLTKDIVNFGMKHMWYAVAEAKNAAGMTIKCVSTKSFLTCYKYVMLNSWDRFKFIYSALWQAVLQIKHQILQVLKSCIPGMKYIIKN